MSGIALRGVSRAIGGTPIVTGITFEVPAGERLALVGESGSGKSTILRLLGGFDRVDAGEIDLGGRRLSDRGTHVPPRHRRIATAPQEGALFPHLTAGANIGFGVPRRDRAARVQEVARLVGLDPALLGRFPHELSGGQQQRVALGRALATRPEALLLDEPFSALDTGLREATREEVVAVLAASGTTTVLVTHDQREALRFGHRIGVVDGGALVQVGTPADLLDAPATLVVFRTLGSATVLSADGDGDRVRTALGGVEVGNDRSAGAARTVVALRPGQIAVERDDAGDAVVTARHDDGDRVRFVLQAGAERVDADLDRPAAAGIAAGDRVHAVVRGPASRYPDPRSG